MKLTLKDWDNPIGYRASTADKGSCWSFYLQHVDPPVDRVIVFRHMYLSAIISKVWIHRIHRVHIPTYMNRYYSDEVIGYFLTKSNE